MMTMKHEMFMVVSRRLAKFEGNRTKTAESLGLCIRTLRNYLKEMKAEGFLVLPPDIGKSLKQSKEEDEELIYDYFPSNEERVAYRDEMLNRDSL